MAMGLFLSLGDPTVVMPAVVVQTF